MADQRAKILETFNNFNGKNLAFLDSFYADDVVFVDPAGSVSGLANLKKYYSHAYSRVQSISFDFKEIFQDGDTYSAFWVMTLAVRGLNGGKPYQVQGMSRLTFDSKGLVKYHRDYLDLGEMVYEAIPVVGVLIKKIKKALHG